MKVIRQIAGRVGSASPEGQKVLPLSCLLTTFIIGLLPVLVAPAVADEDSSFFDSTRWIVDSASYSYRPNLTIEQIKDSAIQMAKDRILDRGVLNYWRTEATLRLRSDMSGNKRMQSHASYEYERPRGKLIDFEVLDSYPVRESIAGTPSSRARLVERMRVVVRAKIAPDTVRPDPGFDFNAKLDPRVLREFETMHFTVQATQDCWLTLFVMESDGTMSLIFPDDPNDTIANFIPANTLVQIPPPDAGWNMEARLKPGLTHSREMAVAVATKSRVPFLPQGDTTNSFGFLSVNSGLQEFVRWIGRIPSDQMVQVGLPYDIFEK